MTAPRQTLLARARTATLGLVLAAGAATGLLTVAAAQATPPAPTPTRLTTSYVGDDDGGARWSDDQGWQPPTYSNQGGNGSVAGSHSS